MKEKNKKKLRIAIYSRYNLAEQYDLAAEFRLMLKRLASTSIVYHLSLHGMNKVKDIPKNVKVDFLPLKVNRSSAKDVLFKFVLMYLFLPLAVVKLRRFKPDVIFISEILPFVAIFFKMFCKTNVATAYCDWHFHNQLGGKKIAAPFLRLVELIDKFEAKRVDGFFSRSEAAGRRLIKFGIKPYQIRVVHDAPDLNDFFPKDKKELRARIGFKKDDIVLFYHGVMHSGKGLDKLLIWTADLVKENPKIGIIMVGTGMEYGKLRELATQKGLGKRAIFTGYLKTVKEIADYCNAADICVGMRTKSEANARIVPGALLHTMACRKLTIGPDLEGIKEVIRHGENGFMFKADDEADFKELIRYLIRNRKDWGKIERNAYNDIINNYTIEKAAEQYSDAIVHFADI